MTFAEKCAVLLDANERALELHVGTGGAQLFDYEEEGGGGRKRYQESYGNFSTRRGAGGDGDFSKRGGGKFKKQEKSEEVDRTERMVSLGSAGRR